MRVPGRQILCNLKTGDDIGRGTAAAALGSAKALEGSSEGRSAAPSGSCSARGPAGRTRGRFAPRAPIRAAHRAGESSGYIVQPRNWLQRLGWGLRRLSIRRGRFLKGFLPPSGCNPSNDSIRLDIGARSGPCSRHVPLFHPARPDRHRSKPKDAGGHLLHPIDCKSPSDGELAFSDPGAGKAVDEEGCVWLRTRWTQHGQDSSLILAIAVLSHSPS